MTIRMRGSTRSQLPHRPLPQRPNSRRAKTPAAVSWSLGESAGLPLASDGFARRRVALGNDCSSFAVQVHCEPVDHERISDEIHELTSSALRMGSAEKHGIIQGTVDGFDVIAPAVDPFEIRITRGDLPHIFRPIELPSNVSHGRVEPVSSRAVTPAQAAVDGGPMSGSLPRPLRISVSQIALQHDMC